METIRAERRTSEENMVASDEAGRLNALRQYRILDTEPEQAFDDLTLIASQICGVPIALISLVDEDRQWFKSRVGVEVRETSRSVSFCAHAILQQGIFTIADALTDERFCNNPFVKGEPHVRFYAGAPITTQDGYALGTLCVIDYVPRELTADQENALSALQRQVSAQLELRRNLEELRVALEEIQSLSSLIPFCSTCEFNIVIPADTAMMQRVTGGVNDLLAGRKWSEQKIMEVDLALQEALANAIRHGCKNDSSKQVQCCVTFDASGELVIVVRDPGAGFDLAAVPNPLEGDGLLRASGRGVFLINQLMDSAEYAEGGRKVLMRKRPAETVAPAANC
jgi:anti-sigma regulatory factor (Ser/Thr protein kinase)